jgi:CBS domain-containing protein
MELLRNLRSDTVARLQPSPPWAVEADRSVADAVRLMRWKKTGCLLVTRGGRLAGVFTERDLLTRLLAPGRSLDTPMSVCLTPDPVTVHPLDPVWTAVRRMEKGGYRHLPVVDDANRPVGILSARRVVHYLVEHFPTIIYNQPPDPNRYPDAADGA